MTTAFQSSLLSALTFLLAASFSFADPLPFRSAIDVQEVSETGTSWNVFGRVYDSSTAGFTGEDVQTNDLFLCETPYQDCDKYRLTEIVTQTVDWVRFICEYVGTGATPRVGAPMAGQGYLCRSYGTNAVALPQYYGPGGVSPFLKDGIASDAIRTLASQVSGSGSTSTGAVAAVKINGATNYPDGAGLVDLGTIEGGGITNVPMFEIAITGGIMATTNAGAIDAAFETNVYGQLTPKEL